jgi:hypothetical protein
MDTFLTADFADEREFFNAKTQRRKGAEGKSGRGNFTAVFAKAMARQEGKVLRELRGLTRIGKLFQMPGAVGDVGQKAGVAKDLKLLADFVAVDARSDV